MKTFQTNKVRKHESWQGPLFRIAPEEASLGTYPVWRLSLSNTNC